MKREYSLAQLTVLNASPPELARIAAECGYDYFSARQIYMGLPEEPNYDLSKNHEMMKETKAVMAETGIRFLDIELARIVADLDVKRYENAFQTAAELGGTRVLSSIWTDNEDYYTEKFAEVCDLAAQYHLTVELEYVPIAAVKNLAGAVKVLRAVNRPNAGLLIDMHHFQRAQDDPAELDKLPREWFHMLHLCDTTADTPADLNELRRIMREDRDYIGEGGVDIKAIMAHIPNVPCSIELPKNSVSDVYGYKEHARRCLASAKKYFGNE